MGLSQLGPFFFHNALETQQVAAHAVGHWNAAPGAKGRIEALGKRTGGFGADAAGRGDQMEALWADSGMHM